MDVLSDILRLLRLRANIFFHANMCGGGWSLDSSGSGRATFHLIARGSCWLHRPGVAPVPLQGGDLIVFPHDAVHVISAHEQRPAVAAHSGVIEGDGNGPATRVVCGYFDFDSPQANPLLAALPEVVHIRGETAATQDWLDMLLRLIAAESERDAAGRDVVIDRLADVLFIQVIRAYMQDHQDSQGLLAALADQRINRVLQAVHAAPEQAWSVAQLADIAAMSRAAFAKRFNELVGQAPMTYVAHWRMQRAYEWLRTTDRSVAAIAECCGYQTEAAFRKAFKQHMGVGPGAVRRT